MEKEDSTKEDIENTNQVKDFDKNMIVTDIVNLGTTMSFDLNAPPLDLNISFAPTTEPNTGDPRDARITGLLPPNKIFSCNYCRRKFYSSQALGGHQNAHKKERTLAKHAMRIGWLPNMHINLSSSSSITSTPSIDIQAHHHQPSILPLQQVTSSFYDLRGGPAKLGGQNDNFVENLPTAFAGAMPYWPESFRHFDNQAQCSINYIHGNDYENNCNSDNVLIGLYHNDVDIPNSSPDLSLKL